MRVVPSPGSTATLPVPAPEGGPVSGPGPTVAPPDEAPGGDLVPAPVPRHGGVIRLLAGDPSIDLHVARSNVAEGVRPGGLLLAWREPRRGSPCWILELAPGTAFPDGAAVTASEVARYWIDAFAREGDEARWLLEPLVVPGGLGDEVPSIATSVRAEGQVLELCPHRPAPDLPQRLAHPALWLARGDGNPGAVNGPGPFFQAPDGTLRPNPGFHGPGPYVDRVETLSVEGDPIVPLRLGDAHLAVVFGKAARALRQDPGPSLTLDRLPAWDRTYFLWLNPSKRWVNDPLFRRWIGGAIDREQMVAYLFDGQGRRAFSLSVDGSGVPVYPLQAERPVSPSTVPRLELAYDATDAHAETVARRIRAVLEVEGQSVTLSLDPLAPGDLRARLSRGDVEMALIAHRPETDDPVLGLLGTLWWLGPDAVASRDALTAASSTVDPGSRERRREAAWTVEHALLEDARIVPLIRLEAWIARHPSLAGVAPGPDGVLRLEEAWWLP